MEKKNVFMMIGAFVLGAVIVGAVAFGGGDLLQGNLKRPAAQNPLTPTDKQQCTFTCDTAKAMVAEHDKQQADINSLAVRLSEAENKINFLIADVTAIRTNDLNDIYSRITAVEDRTDFISWYSYNRFTIASGRFENLGLEAIADLGQILQGLYTP